MATKLSSTSSEIHVINRVEVKQGAVTPVVRATRIKTSTVGVKENDNGKG